MELTGRIKFIMDTQTYDSGFSKREFVINTNEQYPQDIKFELIKEKTSLIDQFNPGEEVNVLFNIRGREYNGRYFVNLQAWKINHVTETINEGQDNIAGKEFITPEKDDDDGMPF